MITGFTTTRGYASQVRERCLVSERGRQVTYLGSVNARITRTSSDMLWTYHVGMFADAQVIIPGAGYEVDCFRCTAVADDTSSLVLRTNPPLIAGTDSKFIQHVDMEHEYPLSVFRRTSGKQGLELLKLQVGFTDESLPRRIWRSEWERDGPQIGTIRVLAEEPVELFPSSEGPGMKAVVLELEDIPPHRTFGLHWEW
jgi:hypothetical protein